MSSRIPLTRKLAHLHRRNRIVELREANIPLRLVAKDVGLSEQQVSAIYSDYFNQTSDRASLTQLVRKYERRAQLEALDAMTMRWVQETADPPKAKAAGYGPRDFAALVDTSRRLKGDLIALDGLSGPNAVAAPSGPGSGVDGSTGHGGDRESVIIQRFINGLGDKYPNLFKAFVATFGAEGEAALNGDGAAGLDPGGASPAEDGGPAATGEADSGPDDTES